MTRETIPSRPDDRAALDALSLLGKKWHPVVLLALGRESPTGFNALLERIPDVSGKVLSDTLGALEDAGLVDRQVVNESPLRVEYGLTTAGEELAPVFEALAEWGERHLETTTPTVLIADRDRRITELYGSWLTDRYTVVRAHDWEEVTERRDDGLDVVVFDEGLPGVDRGELPERLGEECRTIMLVGDRPGVELLEVDCDDVRRKPVVRETLLEAIDAQLERKSEPPGRRERAALSRRLALLERVYARERLSANDAYLAARSRLEDEGVESGEGADESAAPDGEEADESAAPDGMGSAGRPASGEGAGERVDDSPGRPGGS